MGVHRTLETNFVPRVPIFGLAALGTKMGAFGAKLALECGKKSFRRVSFGCVRVMVPSLARGFELW